MEGATRIRLECADGQIWQSELYSQQLLQILSAMTGTLEREAERTGRTPRQIWEQLFPAVPESEKKDTKRDMEDEEPDWLRLMMGVRLFLDQFPEVLGIAMRPYPKKTDQFEWLTPDEAIQRGRCILGTLPVEELERGTKAFLASSEWSWIKAKMGIGKTAAKASRTKKRGSTI